MAERWHPTQAIGPDGKIADVRNVANGVKCGCICFECEQPVVARQGPKVRWHFAHCSASNCEPTRESELHFFAKELLAARRCLWIPSNEVRVGQKTVVLSNSKEFSFLEVRIEKQDGNVRPDLILISKDGRACHVEIFVRHKVDPIKLAKLKSRDISSFEIDLSNLHWDDRSEWENAILEKAPRHWLHNAKALKVAKQMIEQAAVDAKKKADFVKMEVSKISEILSNDLEINDAVGESGENERLLACRRGFHSMINHPVKGDKCFTVPCSHWQSILVNHFLWECASVSKTVFETKDALKRISHLIRPGLTRMSPDVSAELGKLDHDFASPWHAVHSYLKLLKDQYNMFDKRFGGKQWLVSGSATYHKQAVQQKWEDERERKAKLADWLDAVLSRLPEAEHKGFDRLKWINWLCVSYDDDDVTWKLSQIWEMVMEGGGLAYDLLDLPLQREFERQEQAEAERRAEQQRQRDADQQQAQRNSRISVIYLEAHRRLIDADQWLQSNNSDLDGATPISFAAQSNETLAIVTDLLATLVKARREQEEENKEQARRRTLHEKNREELRAVAFKRTDASTRANLWLGSPHPKLGGAKPIDYCVDVKALSYCLSIMPKHI